MSHLLFLSHAGIDSEIALRLAERIENSAEAQRAGLRVFIDKADLRAGGRWKDQLQQALHASTAFAVYVGSKGVVNWVWDEISVALDRVHTDLAYPLIPVLSVSADVQELPSFLSQYHGVTDVENRVDQFEQLLRGILRLDPRDHVAAEREPFVGLEAFDSHKAHLFFGREPEIEALVNLLRRETLVMIVGDSGSGKSSLVKAGLVPAFRGGRLSGPREHGPDDTLWYVVETRPSNDPFASLADDLRKVAAATGKGPVAANEIAELVRAKKPSTVRDALLSSTPIAPGLATKVLLVVDQFEELRASLDAAAYTDMLLALTRDGDDTIRVVLTMRRDYYYLCSRFPAFYDRLERNNRRARYHLHRIDRPRLRSCVIEPLRLAGIDAPMCMMVADAVMKDTGDEPGELALLQMALWRAWGRRTEHSGNLILAYEAIGRIEGAIAQHAEDMFRSLTPEEQQRAEGLFLRLVRPGEAGGVTRRTARLNEFDAATQTLAQKLGMKVYRLLMLGEETVEITHEALATQWHLYQQWITNTPDDPRGDDLRTLQSLIADAAGWTQADKKKKREHLARGHDCSLYSSLAMRRANWMTKSEHAYIHASRQSAWWSVALRRSAVFGLVLLTVLAAVVGFVAEQQRQFALARQLAAQAEQVSQRASLLPVSVLLAIEALQHLSSLETDQALRNRLALLPRPLHDLRHAGSVSAVSFSPDGRLVVSGSWDKTVQVRESSTGKEVARMTHASLVTAVGFSPDGRSVVSGSGDKTVRVWESSTGKEVARMTHAGWVSAVSFSPDGRLVVSGSGDKTVRVWESSTGKEVARMTHDDWVSAVSFNPDGRSVVSGSEDKTAQVWESSTGKEVARMTHDDWVSAVSFNPDGRSVVSGSRDKTVRVWESSTSKEVARMTHDDSVTAVSFSPDGRLVVSGSEDKTVRVWESSTGKEVARMTHAGWVRAVSFSPDGRLVVSGSEDKTAQVWESSTGKEVARMTHDDLVSAVSFNPDGRLVVSGSRDKTVRVRESSTGKEVARMTHDDLVWAVSFSPDGRLVVSGSADKTARVWESSTGKEVARMTHDDLVWAVSFSPDGRLVVSGSADNTVRVLRWRPEDLIAEACSRLTRNLRKEEWRLYLGNEPYQKTCKNFNAPTES